MLQHDHTALVAMGAWLHVRFLMFTMLSENALHRLLSQEQPFHRMDVPNNASIAAHIE
jgi:hypothetical protein